MKKGNKYLPEPSKIIVPHDRIIIDIDHTKSPEAINMHISRSLPWPYVVSILMNLANNLLLQGYRKLPPNMTTLEQIDEAANKENPVM